MDTEKRVTITPEDARRRLGIGRTQVYEALRAGKVPHIKWGRRYLIPEAAFERMLACDKPQASTSSADATV